MRIAILNPYEAVAETESCQRIILAAKALGYEATECRRSSEVNRLKPDFVLSISHQDAKLTRFPTYGVITAPTAWLSTPRFLRNLLTYDGYLTVSDKVGRYIRDLLFSVQKVAEVEFYANTYPRTDFHPLSIVTPKLAYFGTNWDGPRYGQLFMSLSTRPYMEIYGPADKWRHVDQSAVKGSVPFDGVASCLSVYSRAGVGLCIHRQEFSDDALPNNRIFEICAAGAVVISDNNAFVERHFGDSVLYVDTTKTPQEMVQQIDAHMRWIRDNPGKANEMASRAHDVFVKNLSLEGLLGNVVSLHKKTIARKHYIPVDALPYHNNPTVGIIVRAGGRPISMVQRALNSIRSQSYRNLKVFLILYKAIADLDAVLDEYRNSFPVSRIECFGGNRSASLWAGLRALDTDLFGVLDDDDELFPNHISLLVDRLKNAARWSGRESRFVYAGNVEEAESDEVADLLVDINSLPRTDSVRIEHFSPPSTYEMDDLLSGRLNPMMSNAWIAKTELLDEHILQDPEMNCGEDYFLVMCLAQKTTITFCPEITSVHHRHDGDSSRYESYGAETTKTIERKFLFRSKDIYRGLKCNAPSPVVTYSTLSSQASVNPVAKTDGGGMEDARHVGLATLANVLVKGFALWIRQDPIIRRELVRRARTYARTHGLAGMGKRIMEYCAVKLLSSRSS